MGGGDADISNVLRREFVRQTIVGIVTSTRTVNAEAAVASPVYNNSHTTTHHYRDGVGGGGGGGGASTRWSSEQQHHAGAHHPSEMDGRVHSQLSKLRTPLLLDAASDASCGAPTTPTRKTSRADATSPMDELLLRR